MSPFLKRQWAIKCGTSYHPLYFISEPGMKQLKACVRQEPNNAGGEETASCERIVRVEGNTIQLLSDGPPLTLIRGESDHEVYATWATNGIPPETWWCLRPPRLLRQPPPPPSDQS